MKNEDSKLLEEYSGLFELLELQLEDRISRSEFERLEAMIRHDSTARKLYLQYIDLHGMLHYDTAAPHVAATTEAADATIPKTQPVPAEIRRQRRGSGSVAAKSAQRLEQRFNTFTRTRAPVMLLSAMLSRRLETV